MGHTQPVHFLFVLLLNHSKDKLQTLGSTKQWLCTHIDELREPTPTNPSLYEYADRAMSSIFNPAQIASSQQLLMLVSLIRNCISPAVSQMSTKKILGMDQIRGKLLILEKMLDQEEGMRNIHLISDMFEPTFILNDNCHSQLVCPSFYIFRTTHFFLTILHEIRIQEGCKCDRTNYLKTL